MPVVYPPGDSAQPQPKAPADAPDQVEVRLTRHLMLYYRRSEPLSSILDLWIATV